MTKINKYWSKDHSGARFEISGDAPSGVDFTVNQRVLFTNDYGVTFGPYRILGFDNPAQKFGRCVYLDWSTPWFPTKPNNLRPAP